MPLALEHIPYTNITSVTAVVTTSIAQDTRKLTEISVTETMLQLYVFHKHIVCAVTLQYVRHNIRTTCGCTLSLAHTTTATTSAVRTGAGATTAVAAVACVGNHNGRA